MRQSHAEGQNRRGGSEYRPERSGERAISGRFYGYFAILGKLCYYSAKDVKHYAWQWINFAAV